MTTAILEKPVETEKVLQKVTPIEKTKDIERNFELMPLYDPAGALMNWKLIREGMEKVLDYTCGEASIERIHNDLANKHLLLWLGYQDGEYCGFMTTRIDNGLISNLAKVKSYISIVHLYVKAGTSPECFFSGLLQLKKLAKTWKCDSIRMWTIKADWGRALMNRGFKPKYVEYELEIK